MAKFVKDIDRGLKDIMGAVRLLDDSQVQVGILDSAGDRTDGTPHALVAAANEFGTATIPARPFVRTTFDAVEPDLSRGIRRAYRRLRLKIQARKIREELGEEMRDAMRETVVRWQRPPNAPSTIAKKGFNDPLVDSLEMANAIDYKVVD